MTAEYDIYLTPSQNSQIYLLQYPNRDRSKPYNARSGVSPQELRIKPNSGHIELDVNLNTAHNFNKYRGLMWGDAVRTGKEVQNDSATYGLASGFAAQRRRHTQQARLADQADREFEIQNDLNTFYDAEKQDKVLHKQTLGGQIVIHDSTTEEGKPSYFVGAFRGSELHLSKVTGTAQMRPQFHHLDAEDQRSRLAKSKEVASENPTSTANAPEVARVVHQSYKSGTTNPKGELEQRSHAMRRSLQISHEEPWVRMEFVDEDDTDAFDLWHERMFIKDTSEEGGCATLKSDMADEDYLDAMSASGRGSPTRKRRRAPRKKEAAEFEDAEPVEVGTGG